MGTEPGAVLAKQEDSTSTWINSQNRKIPHPKDSAPNLVQYSQNRKIPHQPEAIRKTGRFRTKKIPHQTWCSTRKTGRFHINLEHFAKQEDSTSTWSNSQNRKIPHQPGAIHRTGRFCIKKIPHQTRYNTHKLAIRDFK